MTREELSVELEKWASYMSVGHDPTYEPEGVTLLRAAAQALREQGEMSAATSDVIAERHRQTESEGWTAEHDDEHDSEEMADAAACYASSKTLFWPAEYALDVHGGDRASKDFVSYQPLWPWDCGWWKPRDRRRDLVRAGALIIAEIERIDRAARRALQQGGEG